MLLSEAIYEYSELAECEINIQKLFFEIVATYFYPKAYIHTSSLVEYGGNIQNSIANADEILMKITSSSTRSNSYLLRALVEKAEYSQNI